MSNLKLPDVNDLKKIANKLYHDIKKSVSEIVEDMKNKEASNEDAVEKPVEEVLASEHEKKSEKETDAKDTTSQDDTKA